MQRQILPPLACTVKSVVYISEGGGVGVGEGLEGRWGWLKKLKMENPNLLIYYYLNSSEPIIICKFT